MNFLAALWQRLIAAMSAGKRASTIDVDVTPTTRNPQRATASASTMDIGVKPSINKARRAAASATDIGVAPTTSKAQIAAPPTSTRDVSVAPRTSQAPRADVSDVWPQEVALLPWYDQPDWDDRLVRMRHERQLSAADEAMLRKWCEDGYVVVPGLVAAELIDSLVDEIDDMWERNVPIEGLAVSAVDLDDGRNVHVPHSELVRIPLARRRRIKEISNWRVGQYHLYSKSARQIFDHPGIGRIASTLFARRGVPRYSLLFSKGTEQDLRQDTCFFHVFPRNFMMGIWIA